MIGLEQWRAAVGAWHAGSLRAYRHYVNGKRRIVRNWQTLVFCRGAASIQYSICWIIAVLFAFVSEGVASALGFNADCQSLCTSVKSPGKFCHDSLQYFQMISSTFAATVRSGAVDLCRLVKSTSPSLASMLRLLIALHWLLIVAGDVELNPGPVPQEIKELLSQVDDSELYEGDIFDVFEEVVSLAGRWTNVCFALRLLPSHEDTIAKSCNGIPEDCLRKVLSKWLQRCYDTTRHGPPTWQMLVAAVGNSAGGDNPGLAKEIARSHPGTAQTARSTPPQAKRSTDPSSTVVSLHAQYLRVMYQTQIPTFLTLQWPPPPTYKIFNLAMIQGQTIRYGPIDEEMVRLTLQGKVKDILYEKKAVKLKNIFQLDNAEHKVILIEGAPGAGKSTLAWHVCQTWESGKLFQDYQTVVYVQLRDRTIQSAQSIEDIIPAESRGQAKRVMEEIRSCRGQNLLIVLDGWDELPSQLHTNSIFQQLIAFPANLNLQLSAVIVTSRPIASGDLYRFISSRIEMLGFTPTEVKDYFTEALGGEAQAVQKLQDQLEECPMVEACCYLPLNAGIVTHLFLAQNYRLPATLHEVFTMLILSCLKRHVAKQGERGNQRITSLDNLPSNIELLFKDVCTLAYHGVMDNKATFSMEYLESHGLSKISETLGLLQGVESIKHLGDTSPFYYFLHLSVQELLAAFYITKLPGKEQVVLFNKLFGEPRLVAVFRFYTAFTKLDNESIRSIIVDIVKKKDKHQILYLLHGLYEAQSLSLCKFVGSQLGRVLNLSKTTLSPVDCLAVGYFISCFIGEFTAVLEQCSLDSYRVRYLSKGVSKYTSSISMHKPDSAAKDAGEASCLELNLKLSGNSVGDEGAALLCGGNVIHLLQTLDLSGNNISDEGGRAIASALRINRNLTALHLGGNKLSDELGQHIAAEFPGRVDVTTVLKPQEQENIELLHAVNEVMKKKGKLEQTILQGVFIGPPRNGKSSLMKRLLNQELPTSSTDVVENITQVTFKKPAMSTANIKSDSESDANVFTWSELSFDDEVLALLEALSRNTNFCESEKVPAAEESTTSIPQFEEVHTPDPPSEEVVQDVGETRSDIQHTSSHTLTPTHTIGTSASEIPEAKFKTHQDIFKESLEKGWSEAKKYFESACTMYLTDTGGQLEFQELLPALVSGPSIFFLVFRLDWDLNTEFEIHYSHSKKGQSKSYPSKIKLKDALLQSLASIAAMGTFVYEGQQMEKLQPKVFFVGTHKDIVNDDEKIKLIDKELQDAVKSTSFFRQGLIQMASDDPRFPRMLLTVDNTSDDDDSGIKQVRRAVERIINQRDFIVRAPPQWLIFSLVLRQTTDQPVISYAQCQTLARNCGINDSEELDKALWFLSTRVGLIRYYRNASLDLRNLVVLDPSIIFRKISKLVIETFTFQNPFVRNPSVCKDFVDKGLFWLCDFEKLTAKCDKELLTPRRLIDLLQHLHIIARIEKDGKSSKLFMPCILKSTKSSGSEASRDPNVPPLLVCFDCGYCPKGIFPALVAYLLNHSKEKGSEYPWELQEEEIYKNQVSFTVDCCTVSLKVVPKYIEVLCTPSDPTTCDPTTCHEVCMSLKRGMCQVTSDLHYAMETKWHFAFFCQCGEGDHGAVLEGRIGEHKCRLRCTISRKPFKPPIGCDVWFPKVPLAASTGPGGDHPQPSETTYMGPPPSKKIKIDTEETKGAAPKSENETTKPVSDQDVLALDDLLAVLNELHELRANWYDLGLSLKVKVPTLDAIQAEHRDHPKSCLRDMIKHWLRQENPRPCWNAIVTALDTPFMSQSRLAETLRAQYCPHQHPGKAKDGQQRKLLGEEGGEQSVKGSEDHQEKLQGH